MDALVARLTLWSLCFLLAALAWFAVGAVATWVLHLGDPPILVDIIAAAALSLVFYAAADNRRRARPTDRPRRTPSEKGELA